MGVGCVVVVCGEEVVKWGVVAFVVGCVDMAIYIYYTYIYYEFALILHLCTPVHIQQTR